MAQASVLFPAETLACPPLVQLRTHSCLFSVYDFVVGKDRVRVVGKGRKQVFERTVESTSLGGKEDLAVVAIWPADGSGSV